MKSGRVCESAGQLLLQTNSSAGLTVEVMLLKSNRYKMGMIRDRIVCCCILGSQWT